MVAGPFWGLTYSTGQPDTARLGLLVAGQDLATTLRLQSGNLWLHIGRVAWLPVSASRNMPPKVFPVMCACPLQARTLYDWHLSCIMCEQR